ncbi:MAG: 2-hydroxyacyl-CoA dehydratase [Clostridiales bacterium]|nr:2-hydroxyacyl-CoA dehydratase [Clostridiales bacterium]
MKKPNLKKGIEKLVKADKKKALRDFVYGKPHGERRLGDNYLPKSGLYKHREWRGVKDTMYYFNNIWLYNYGTIVGEVLKHNPILFVKGIWRYRWMGQTYLTVLHWFDRCLEGERDQVLRASAWHLNGLVKACLFQIGGMFDRDIKIGGSETLRDRTMAHDETVWGGVFYPYRDQIDNIPLQMIPYFVTCHCNSHTVLNYIDAAQSIGLPGDPCPMCQAEAGVFVQDDMPDYYRAVITSNEACDGSVGTSVIQDWMMNKPLYAMPQPMRFDDESLVENCAKEIEGAFRFIEEQMGAEFHWDELVKQLEEQNKLQRFEREKWDVAANTKYSPINAPAQALYRIFSSQYGNSYIWHETDARVKKILDKCVEQKINTFPLTRHRAIAWSCAPLYYSALGTWGYNCWGINTIINMDSLMFDMEVRTDSYENTLHDMAVYHEWAPMRRMAVGGLHHVFELWENMEKFNCDFVLMYDQLQCKGMQGCHGLFEDEFRARDINAIWIPHALPDKRTVSRREQRKIISDYMYTVMGEEPLDPSLVDFDDDNSW